ncbi:AAA family ATPase [Microtetraspora malaysiensis]|uniref:AAA family ATPase n=1 Tax=Microtetraspora malaysiensis TaxID=161358 RepID=UPI003D8A87E1
MFVSRGQFGRTEESELIASFLDRAALDGSALLIAGEPGIGKTTLLNEAADAAAAAGFRVLRSEGGEFEADIAFSGLNRALMPLLGTLDELSERHRDALTSALGLGHGSTPDLMVVGTAALSLLRHAAKTRALVLLVDDLQWLDRSSAEVLSFVARRLSGSKVGFLAAVRAETAGLFGRGTVPAHELRRLDDASASDLLGAWFPMLAPQVRTRVLAEAQGNPLALLELAGAAGRRQEHPRAEVQGSLPPSHRVQALFASHVADLPTATRTLLLLAVLDGTGELGVLRSSSGDAELLGLAPAERAGLVRVDEENRRLVFRHPLIRSGVIGISTAHERRHAHLALAEVLVDQPERRAWHLAEATMEPDEEVAALLERVAGGTLRKGDALVTMATLRRAGELSPRPADRARRLVRAAYIGRLKGDLRDVSRLLTEAQQADPASGESLEAAVTMSYLLLTDDGDIDAAHRLLVGAIERHAGCSDVVHGVLADALRTLLQVCWFAGRPELWKPLEAAITRLGPDLPDALALYSGFYADPARVAAPALARLDAAIGSLHEVADPADIVGIVDSAFFLDRLGGCRQPLLQVVADGRAGDGSTSMHSALIALSIDDFLTGRWDEADGLLDELLRVSQALGYHMLWPAQHVQALLAAARGDFATTWALADEMSRWAEPRGMHTVRWYCHHARTLAALGQGDFEYAYLQATAISPPGTFASYVPHAVWVAMDLVEAAMHTNRQAEAAAHVTAMNDEGIAALSPRLALLTGASAAIAAPDNQADELFEAALALPGIDRWPFDLARVQLAYGARLRRARSRVKAREHLSAALEVFRWLGALPWATRASNEIRATGRASSRGAALPPNRLTPQERQIAMLAAEGMTNKQIGERLKLSHRTVSSHLHRLYPKLGIATRSALNGALANMQFPSIGHLADDEGE